VGELLCRKLRDEIDVPGSALSAKLVSFANKCESIFVYEQHRLDLVISGKYSFEALWAGEDAVIDVGVGVPAKWSKMSYKAMLEELEKVQTKARDEVMDGTAKHVTNKRRRGTRTDDYQSPKRTLCSYCKGQGFYPWDDHVDTECKLLEDCQAERRRKKATKSGGRGRSHGNGRGGGRGGKGRARVRGRG
jgi:hypothetical protein